MATISFFLVLTLFICVHTLPNDDGPLEYRNTIFVEETLPGEIFEKINTLTEITPFNTPPEAYRLPRTTRPTHYDLTVTIDVANFTIAGLVDITLLANQPDVSEIVIHSHELNITNVRLFYSDTEIPVTHDENTILHFLIISLENNETLVYDGGVNQIYNLRIEYEREMREDMYGIYRSWYRENNETKWMATTQFQPTSARQAFPCYDEPSFKAKFDISIIRPIGFRSWSCMRQNFTDAYETGFEIDVYHTTPTMSTYLIAIIVADYEAEVVENSDGDVTYEVIGRREAMEDQQGDYAFNLGQDLLRRMDIMTGIPYLDVDSNLKMTQASIPDFSAGAMENWGLLTYREAYLMYHENHTDYNFKQTIANILTHEIAHMWYGNLVTCDWWDVLWLNEGFATFYQYFLTGQAEPNMGFNIRFIPEQVHTSLLADSSINAHPLTNTGVGSPGSVGSMFSTISYNKGAAVIRMTEHLLGAEVHRRGLHRYLTQRYLNTALPIHLFNALQSIALEFGAISQYNDFSVVDYYRTWTEQPGHPVLLVQVNHRTGEMVIQQRRFDINTGYAPMNQNWIIPITFVTADDPNFTNTKPTHIIRHGITVINRGTTGDQWVLFNTQQTGFYRVMYDDYTWGLITLALRGEDRLKIHEYTKAQIVNDVFSFARAGLMSYSRAFNILSFLQYETDYAPWAAAVTGFNWIRNRFIGTELEDELGDIIVRLATRVMAEVGYIPEEDESFMRAYLRMQLAPLMCQLNVPECRNTARELFSGLKNNGTEVPVNIRRWVYCNALRDGDETDFDFLWDRYMNHTVYSEKVVIQLNIGCTPIESRIYQYLDAITYENELVRRQDYNSAWSSAVSGNENNTQIVLQYVKENITHVREAFGNYYTPLSYIAARLRTEEEINEYVEWLEEIRDVLGDAFNATYNSAESARESIIWARENAADINEYINIGDLEIETTTEATIPTADPVTMTTPNFEAPTTPNLDGSAAGVYVSITLFFAAVVVNLL